MARFLSRSLTAGLLMAGLWTGQSWAQKFLPDDPLKIDRDSLSIPKPNPRAVSFAAEFAVNTFVHSQEGPLPPPDNINTLGEVPDSSWYTNRMSRRVLGIEELVRGPDLSSGPQKPWKVVEAKTEGVTPGFEIEDAAGDTYFIKFDPPGHPQLATSSEVVATKFFHAFGYHVPENYLVKVRTEDMIVDSESGISEQTVKRILENVPRLADGTIQALASKKLPGEVIGPFRYTGVRSDDPNDIFPHENRRELRGLGVFGAWLNHFDLKSGNSLDVFLAESEPSGSGGSSNPRKEGHVRHYLIDFGSTLGSGGNEVKHPRAGHEHFFEGGPLLKSALTFGILDRPWWHLDYPEDRAVGNFESEYFHPSKWRTSYPNPAIQRMRSDDAFWAARIISRFDEERIRALVGTGGYQRPESAQLIVDILLERRAKILSHYFSLLNPLDDFEISGNAVTFLNLGERSEVGRVNGYQYQWFRFDNQGGGKTPLGGPSFSQQQSVPFPPGSASYLLVEISTDSPDQPLWKKSVQVFIRAEGNKREIVGVEREL